MRKDKYQVELRVVNGGIERIRRAKRYEEQSALSGRSQESLDLSRAESMVALDKHKHRQASTILVPAKLHSSAPRLLAGDPELSAPLQAVPSYCRRVRGKRWVYHYSTRCDGNVPTGFTSRRMVKLSQKYLPVA